MWCVYILRSAKSGRYYVGSTNDLDRRLFEHNIGHTPSTRIKGPWEVAFVEPAESEREARRRENQIKSWKSRVLIEELVRSGSQ